MLPSNHTTNLLGEAPNMQDKLKETCGDLMPYFINLKEFFLELTKNNKKVEEKIKRKEAKRGL